MGRLGLDRGGLGYGRNPQCAYDGLLNRRGMLEILQVSALLLLIIAHGFLIRGCFGIKTELPLQGGTISSKIDRTADLLDEMAQLISDFSDNMAGGSVTQPVPSPMEAILSAFMSRVTPSPSHAKTSEEWEILPNNDNPTQTKQAEDQPNEPSSISTGG